MARRGRPPQTPASFTEQTYGPDDELALAAYVARAYYLEDRSKVAIAEEVGLSRFQIARLLRVARDAGIVRIEVTNPGVVDRELSALVQQRLKLRRVVVIASPASAPLADVGRGLARLMSETVEEGNVVGLSWSRALRSMVEQMDDVKRCAFVQLAGQMTPEGESIGSVELVRRAAERSGGEAFPVYAPFLVPSSAAAAALLTQPEIARAVNQFDHLDVAFISIGSWAPSLSVIYDAMTETERQAARERGVVGDINGRMFDTHGNTVDPDIDDRTIAITFDQLRRIPQVICSSHGAARAEATLAAMRAEVATTWVLDQALARALLELGT